MTGSLRLNHVAVPARDIGESIRFYSAFGLEQGFTRRDAQGQVDLQQMTGAGGFVELIRDDSELAAPRGHFGLGAVDIAAAVADLAAKGISPLEPVRRGVSGVDFVFFTDPSGNLVEITAPAS